MRARTAVAAALAVLAVAACEPRPGVAAFVGDEQVEVSEVRPYVERGLAAAREAGVDVDAGTATDFWVRLLIESEIARVVAGEHGVSVTDGEVAEVLQSEAAQFGSMADLERQALGSGVAPGDLPFFYRNALLELKVAQELDLQSEEELVSLLADTSRELGVRVNPRFGSWDHEQLELRPAPDELSRPVERSPSPESLAP